MRGILTALLSVRMPTEGIDELDGEISSAGMVTIVVLLNCGRKNKGFQNAPRKRSITPTRLHSHVQLLQP
ncbi:hypothetical protein [Pseudochelatococcus sp. G4_1912]|uniref:hypothetical protein n=1 Tax=Pseudochelatococcus sp. G4_1912 TaxID=3114288 RepID=UPI0039C6E976